LQRANPRSDALECVPRRNKRSRDDSERWITSGVYADEVMNLRANVNVVSVGFEQISKCCHVVP